MTTHPCFTMLPVLFPTLSKRTAPGPFTAAPSRRLGALLVAGWLLWCGQTSLAGTLCGFPKEAPAFTFELPDSLEAQYQADGTLVCTAKDHSLLKGVFQPLPNVHNDRDLGFGLNGVIKLVAPNFLTTDLRYPAPFDKETASGIHTITVSATGRHDGQDSALALIVFSKNGKYYELIVSGALDAMTTCNFPRAFRETAKLTP